MSGSDRFLSMALDDIIKMRRRRANGSSSRAGSVAASTSLNNGRGTPRGSHQRLAQRGHRFAQRGRGQRIVGRGQRIVGRGAQTSRQQFTPQRSFRGQQGGTLSSWRSGQSLASQGLQRGGGPRSWASQQSVATFRGRRPQSVAPVRRGRPQSLVGQGRRQNVLIPRGNIAMRNNQQTRNQLQLRPRGPGLQPAQLARNRVRLATQILLRRKRQLQQLQMLPQGQSERGGRLLRRGGPTRAMNRITSLATRAQVTYKMKRVNRNREAQSQMLSVNIHNERAVASETLRIPPLVVINRPPELSQQMALSAMARSRQNMARQERAQLALQPEQVQLMPLPLPTSPARKLTLHERFSQS